MTKTTELKDLSMSFAIKIIRLYETIQGHSSLRNQLERSATSIGANLREANYAHSNIDFISKLKIALKGFRHREACLDRGTSTTLDGRQRRFGQVNQRHKEGEDPIVYQLTQIVPHGE